jgi:hypothetical protein
MVPQTYEEAKRSGYTSPDKDLKEALRIYERVKALSGRFSGNADSILDGSLSYIPFEFEFQVNFCIPDVMDAKRAEYEQVMSTKGWFARRKYRKEFLKSEGKRLDAEEHYRSNRKDIERSFIKTIHQTFKDEWEAEIRPLITPNDEMRKRLRRVVAEIEEQVRQLTPSR